MTTDNRKLLEAALERANKERDDAVQKLGMAQQAYQLMVRAYDALLYHGVNFRSLKSYEFWEKFLHQGEKTPEGHKVRTLGDWIVKVRNDIDAAVRRKSIKEIK